MQRVSEERLVVYVNHRPFACCLDVWEGLHVMDQLQRTRYTNRVHLMKA
jgi:hypothetical protein